MWTLKKEFCLKKQQKHDNLSICLEKSFMENFSFCAVEALRKLHMQLEVPSCLRYGPKSFNLRSTC